MARRTGRSAGRTRAAVPLLAAPFRRSPRFEHLEKFTGITPGPTSTPSYNARLCGREIASWPRRKSTGRVATTMRTDGSGSITRPAQGPRQRPRSDPPGCPREGAPQRRMPRSSPPAPTPHPRPQPGRKAARRPPSPSGETPPAPDAATGSGSRCRCRGGLQPQPPSHPAHGSRQSAPARRSTNNAAE